MCCLNRNVTFEIFQVYNWKNQGQVSSLLQGHNNNLAHKSNFQPLLIVARMDCYNFYFGELNGLFLLYTTWEFVN
uniref:Uncharacterized protein n=1 Tax=Aegilops tauschii subsp. strangulata TaxID=200361 RepID=A0A453JB18_AEGTS